ncbi:MAG: hypothetical protein ACO23H_11085 [Alphaproteobacteria bacterium]
MTWYNADYRRRQIVGINTFGGTGVSATIDIEIDIPPDWDDFWDNIRSDFNDVVVTDTTGELVSFARKAGADYANRVLTLQVDGYQIKHDDSLSICYVYFYEPNETTDHSTSVTISTPKNGYILLSAPHSRVVNARDSQSALDQPVQSFIKSESDEVHVFWIVTSQLAKRLTPYNERNDQEGIEYVTIHSYDDSGVDSSTRFQPQETRAGNGFIRATYRAGSSGSNYAIAINIITTLGQSLENRAILRVIDLLP